MSTSSSSSPADARAALTALVAGEIAGPVAAPVAAMAEAIRARHAAAVEAVLFYGSSLRQQDEPALFDSVLDFYLVVGDYRRAYGSMLLALANRLLPPNVFYLELPWQGRRLRAKYAVIAANQLRRRVQPGHAEPAFWARFCQPTRLVLAGGEDGNEAIAAMLADAVLAFVAAALPLVGADFGARELWLAGFAQTYRAELRAEGAARPETIYGFDPARYDRLLDTALQALAAVEDGAEAGGPYRRRARFAAGAWRWPLRRWLGRAVHLLRLVKGAFTFEGGVDYILWKIERHTGRRPSMSAWERRHPVLAAPVLLVRFYRAGAFR
jgi:hypothetical protein